MEQVLTVSSNECQKLFQRLSTKFEVANNLSRKVVSFQANKDEPIYRWYKYKEGFSTGLVKYFLNSYSTKPGKILDPFAGTGTTLFTAQKLGWESYGIELLPVGVFVMDTKEALSRINLNLIEDAFRNCLKEFEKIENPKTYINHITITKDAFSDENENSLNQYLTYCSTINNPNIEILLRFAAFSILEEISYTRKDGQYLRWDYRSKRTLTGKPFDKGKISNFASAIKIKLNQIITDLSFDSSNSLFEVIEDLNELDFPVKIIQDTCLNALPKFEDNFFDFIITSPPYCNRYDYTRTYALELIYLGFDIKKVNELRQNMLSCTVENKEKIEFLKKLYNSLGKKEIFDQVTEVYNNSGAMTEINTLLSGLNKSERLNNNNIPRMVKNYFLELCFVIYEMARIIRPGGYCVMVNDNVRYGGEEIPVDLILSDFAEKFGFDINKIFVLPEGKGNSSQQMSSYGRSEIRKCVYLWQKKH